MSERGGYGKEPVLIRNAPGEGPALPELHRRLRWVALILVGSFLFLAGRLWQLQVVRGEAYYEQTLSNVVHERFLPSIRGKILDRRGESLADNRPAFNIYATPGRFTPEVAARLVRLLGLSEDEVATMEARIEAGRERSRRKPVLIFEDQSRERAALVKQAGFQLDGIEVHNEPYRTYPHGDLAAHLIGYMNQMNADEYATLGPEGYEPSELIGRYGLERAWENYLRGKKGIERFAVNARGQRITNQEAAELIEGPAVIEPVAGHNLVLTIDAELQRIAERAVRRHPAAAVAVVEAETGRIRALVSKPSFEPNTMTGHLTRQEEALLNQDPRKPFIDKTLRQHYPPGSTYKMVTALAALEDGLVSPAEPLVCPGSHKLGRQVFRCTSSHGPVNLLEAIQHSCNVYFWKLAELVGIDRMAEVALDLGFGAPTGLGLNGDVPGRVPTRAWYEERTSFKIGYTINAATGQGDVEVTVLQLAMAYAALSNGGRLFVPQVVERVETAGGETVIAYEPKLRRRLSVTPEHLALLKQGMWMVVNQLGGTAYEHARSEVVEYAGKTGTAEVRGRRRRGGEEPEYRGWHPYRSHAWFAGYAPVDAPEIVVVVLIEHGGHGGKVAAPAARQILEGYFEQVRPAMTGAAPASAPASAVEADAEKGAQ
ncbi:penicillin-binding protein 2 [Haliangium sp.]|uniref:penicillin-binding protein 2 n=1 Tax=Haliangium sp. TaxID=2663208 RepID=UPI003D151202